MHLPKPEITSVSVDSASNAPGSEADSEVTLDIEVVGAIAPAANIVVYFAPNTNQGFIDAVQTAVSDTGHRLTVLSISWGQPESMWTQSSLSAMNQEFQKAADLGLTVVTAAGDGGVTDNAKDNRPHVDFPSSSPWVLAVGGTKIIVSEGTITSEVAWNDSTPSFVAATGGGVSEIFPLPAWQTEINVPVGNNGRTGRGIPDVAANASPESGYLIYIHGNNTQIGGTAAAAPFWGGLIAIINQGLGHNVGYINPVLYKKLGPAGVLRNITQGNNSVGDVKGYSASPGWNAITGWGSPNGRKLLEALRDEAASNH